MPNAVRVRTSNGWQDIALIGPQGPPSGAMQLIGKYDLVASNTISNIPQTFEHLKLMVRGRCAGNGINNVYSRFNGNSGPNYDFAQMYLQGGQANAQGFAQVAQLQSKIGWASGADSTLGYKGVIDAIIPAYTVLDQTEFISHSWCWTPLSAVVSEMYTGTIGNVYRQNQAITQIQIFGDSAWVAGSYAWLYGITADVEGMRQNWTDVYCQTPQGSTPSTAVSSGVWTMIPIPATPNIVITKADGTNDDFTRNADGSLTINKPGNYSFKALVQGTEAWTTGNNINFGIAKKAGATPVQGDWIAVYNNTLGGTTNNYPTADCEVDKYCSAGDRIALYLWHSYGSARSIALFHFSVHRTGAGPPGPPGGKLASSYAVTSGYTADRAFNPEATSLTEVARTLGTLIDDMKGAGLIP